MLIRRDPDRVVIISQPAHAALSGQLASAWGNAQFGQVEPRGDVCLAAALHDVGWLEWEQSPSFNAETGLPHTFLQLDTRVHLGIWEQASQRALAFGRYPALLTSLHFTGLYERFHDYARDSPDEARDARALVVREQAFQAELLKSLRTDPLQGRFATPEQVERNRRLIAAWDGMSLALCHGVTETRSFGGVPTGGGETELSLEPADGAIIVRPWPFNVDTLAVHADGRALNGTFESETAMRSALAEAEWVTVEMSLRQASR